VTCVSGSIAPPRGKWRTVDAAIASRDRAQARFSAPIATEITEFGAFYPAEDYHQRYYEKTGHEPYCHAIPPNLLRDLGLVPAAS